MTLTYTLVLMFRMWNVGGMTAIPGFSSYQTCNNAGEEWRLDGKEKLTEVAYVCIPGPLTAVPEKKGKGGR